MKKLFSINQSIFLEYSKIVFDNVQKKVIMLAYDYVKIHGISNKKDNFIEITSINPGNIVTAIIPEVEVFEKEFTIIIESSLADILMNKDIDLLFSINEEDPCICTVECPGSKWEISLLKEEEYPIIKSEWSPFAQIHAGQLFKALSRSLVFNLAEPSFAVGNIHLVSTKEYFTIGSTNNFSMQAFKFSEPLDKEFKMMLTKESAAIIKDICKDLNDELISVYSTNNGKDFMFRTEHCFVETIGPAFDYQIANDYIKLAQAFIEREHDSIEIHDKSLFKEQINKAVIFAQANSKVLKIELKPNQLYFEIDDSLRHRKSMQYFDCFFEPKGTASAIGVNYEFLIKIINCTKEDIVKIEIPTEDAGGHNCIGAAIVVQDDQSIYMLQPLMIQ